MATIICIIEINKCLFFLSVVAHERAGACYNKLKQTFVFCERSDKHMEKNEKITTGESDYVKTVLYVYPHLKSFQEAVRQSARNKAALSYKKRDAFAAACEIAEELLFCETLEALEKDLLSALGALSDEERYLVGYRYFHAQGEEYPLSYSERSYYRRQNALLQKIRMLLCARGWTGERFLIEFGRDRLFMRVFNAVREGREGEIVKKRRKKTLAVRQTKSSLSSLRTGGVLREKKTNADTASAAHTAMQTSAICTPVRGLRGESGDSGEPPAVSFVR